MGLTSDDAVTAPNSAVRLFEFSVLALLLEVLLVRWIPSQVRVIAYFTNYVVLACFFGMGLGMLLAQRTIRLARVPPLLLALLLLTQALTMIKITTDTSNLYFYFDAHGLSLPIWLCLPAVYSLTAAVFVPIGQEIGRLFNSLPPLTAYSLNVGGSLVGALLMPFLSFLETPPLVWIVIALGIFMHLTWRDQDVRVAATLLAVCSCTVVYLTGSDALWSPYQKVQIKPFPYDPQYGIIFPWQEYPGASPSPLPPSVGFSVSVNDDYYQSPVDLSEASVKKLPGLAMLRDQYQAVYGYGGKDDILIVGTGTGNDVAAALRCGARHVDAVEIDPVLLRLGRERHPEHPYSDARVTAICDDARSYFKKTNRRYDLVVFAFLDSRRLSARMSGVRLDSYVYTVQSLEDVRRILKPNGLVAIIHASTQWTAKRLFFMMQQVFGRPPYPYSVFHKHLAGFILLDGPGLDHLNLPHAGYPEGQGDTVLPTDDWPFFYLQSRGVQPLYLWLLLVTFLGAAFTLQRAGFLQGLDAGFFLLGAAFMLLETRSITAAALYLGSSWMVTALIIVGVLLMILLANLAAMKLKLPRIQALFALLGVLLATNALISPSILQVDSFWVRGLLAALWFSLPLFGAGLVFAKGFSATTDPSRALGSNLLGCVAGGFLEYASMYTGYAALLWLAFGLYFLAALSWQRSGLSLRASAG